MLFIRKEKEEELLNPKSGQSSMRYAFIAALELVVISVLMTLLILAFQAVMGNDVSFEGAGYFLGGIAAFFTGVAGSKAYQSKHESNG